MKHYLRILKPTKVYVKHELSSRQLKILEPDTIVSFNREKRRNKVNWMEIYLENKKKAYIIKDYENFFKCSNVSLNDDYAYGFSMTYKTEVKSPFEFVFFQENALIKTDNIGIVTVESVFGAKKDRKKYAQLRYDKNLIQVDDFKLRKNEQFYIINDISKKYPLIEIDNFRNKKGYILKNTSYTYKEDVWVAPVMYIVTFAVIIALFLLAWDAGWIVISGLMVIPGIIAAIVVIFILKVIFAILIGIFDYIRKHF